MHRERFHLKWPTYIEERARFIQPYIRSLITHTVIHILHWPSERRNSPRAGAENEIRPRPSNFLPFSHTLTNRAPVREHIYGFALRGRRDFHHIYIAAGAHSLL